MQIVIDIPDNVYKLLKYFEEAMGLADKADKKEDNVKTVLMRAVVHGTPLPKEHGRLGDLSKIYVELNEAQIEGTPEYKGLGAAKQIICDAHTIIEADKEESEG